VSQAEIARQAGVTQAAVSMILGKKAASIPIETRERVLGIAQELGYRADPLARRLAGGRSQLLGLFTYERIFHAASSGLYQSLLLGIEEAAEQSGHDLLLFTSAATPGPVRSIYADGENKLRLVDAAVLLGRYEVTDELEELVAEGYPFVFIGRRFLADGREVPNVAPDYASATRALADQLITLGHHQVAYLGGNPDLPATTDRLAGLRGGGEARVSTYLVTLDSVDERLLDALHDAGITAVVAENTVYAAALRTVAEQHGVTVPTQLSIAVAGIAADTDADWSGYRLPGHEIGQLAVKEALARLDGAPARTQLVECQQWQWPGSSVQAPSSASP
jgi:DNA-binding LacI/PurR family transcriptional regulator